MSRTSQNVAYYTTRRTRTVLVYGPGFNSKNWPSNLGQDHDRECFEFLGQERGLDGVIYNL